MEESAELFKGSTFLPGIRNTRISNGGVLHLYGTFRLTLLRDARVLDAGSGNGRYLGELSRNYISVGVDVSLTALAAPVHKFQEAEGLRNMLGQVCIRFLSNREHLMELFVMGCFSTFLKGRGRLLSGSFHSCSEGEVTFSLRLSDVGICVVGESLQSHLKRILLPGKMA